MLLSYLVGHLSLQGFYFLTAGFYFPSSSGDSQSISHPPRSHTRSRGAHSVESRSATSASSSQQIPTASTATQYQDRIPPVSRCSVNITCVSHHLPHHKRSPGAEDPSSAVGLGPPVSSLRCRPTLRREQRGGSRRAGTWSSRGHSARFCSSREQVPRMNFSQVPDALCPASTPNFSVPSSSATCRRTAETPGSPRDGRRAEKGRRAVCSAAFQTGGRKAGWCM